LNSDGFANFEFHDSKFAIRNLLTLLVDLSWAISHEAVQIRAQLLAASSGIRPAARLIFFPADRRLHPIFSRDSRSRPDGYLSKTDPKNH